MSDATSSPEQPASLDISSHFDEIQALVASEFDVEEGLIEYNLPTFHLRLKNDSKQAFVKLASRLAAIGFTPLLKNVDGKVVLKVTPKPRTKPSRPMINVVLLLVTIVTVFITGYMLSTDLPDPIIGAATFTLALLGILGAHEMAHKVAANRHNMEATLPYFIPGPPPVLGFLGIGTFGAVIVQKETAPNRDALFDVGASGPLAGFIVTIIVSAIGLMISRVELPTEPLSGSLPISPIFLLLMNLTISAPGPGYVVYLHPVAFAGWIGIFVTLLNLLPTGMLDGGHTLRSLIKSDRTRTVFTLVSILILLFLEQWIMLAFVLFLSMYRHPGPLDDVSSLSLSRKLTAILLLVVFALCLFIF
ncbi:MAG: site-2 protease family protein [Candidatus Bathyarchaeota archaeon]|jgi:Zn-dependent protease|nr:MAG: site-2 protease family protein [Candidatus Bathyarchaeota archaeon]